MSKKKEHILGVDAQVEQRDYIDLQNGFSAKPTLFIGLGGTGTQTVSKIKNLFEELYGARAVEGADSQINPIPAMYAFRAFDSDKQSVPTNLIPNKEWIGIGVDDLAGFYDAREQEPEFRDWLLKDFPLGSLSAGCAGLRNLGRICLMANIDEVKNALGDAQNQILTASAPGTVANVYYPSPIVYIFGSLSGGTGAGLLLDTCFLVKELFPTTLNPRFVGVLGVLDGLPTLPSRVKKQMVNNTYSALKELNVFMDLKRQLPKDFPDSIQYPYGINGEVHQPLDECYLLTPQKWNGTRSLPEHEHISSFMARLAFMMSAHIFKHDGNTSPNYAGVLVNNADALVEYQRGARTCYLVPGMAQLHFPIETVATMFALKSATDYLKHLRGGVALDDVAEKQFCEQHRLSYRQLLHEISIDPESKQNQTIGQTIYDDVIDPLFENADTRYEERDRILAYGKAMPHKRATEIERYLSRNVDRMFDDIWPSITDRVAEIMVTDGHLMKGAIDFVDDLKSILAEQQSMLSIEATEAVDRQLEGI